MDPTTKTAAAGDTGPSDHEVVAYLIGREPMGAFTVVLRRADGSPVVLENGPLLDDGRPMPTRFWLADRQLNKWIGRLESEQGVKRAEREISPEALAATHDAYERGRRALLPTGHEGPAPSGGVGGTRIGVKCLHAHYANYLIDNSDVVGAWVHERLTEKGAAFDPTEPGILSRWEDR